MYLGGKQKPDFIARLTYKTTENGGRKTAAKTKYRPQIKIPGFQSLTSGEQTFIDKEIVYPGETILAEITLLSTDIFRNGLFAGQQFEFCEIPDKPIGTGEIIKLINEDLEKK